MNKYVRMLLPVLACGALAITAKAQVSDQMVVKVPFEFVVGGKTLPAGEYRVNRATKLENYELIVAGVTNKTGVLVVSNEIETASSYMPKLIFETVGGQHFLTKIQTGEHIFAVPASQSAILEAAAKARQGSAGAGASGTD